MNATSGESQPLVCEPLKIHYSERLDTSVPYWVNGSLNAVMAIVTTFANLLVLLAMRHVTSIRLPSKLLLCSLVLTDLGTGLVSQPQYAVTLFVEAARLDPARFCPLQQSFVFSSIWLGGASLWTLAAISLDRYTALFFHLQYQQIVTTRRVCAVLGCIWSASLLCATAPRWSSWLNIGTQALGFSVASAVIVVAYIEIYGRLSRGRRVQPTEPQPRRQQLQQQQQQQQSNTAPNMARYRKTASAMMWVCVMFVVCYCPYICAATIEIFRFTALTSCIREFAYTVLLLNSCLNPLLFCLWFREIRAKVAEQVRTCFCPSSL